MNYLQLLKAIDSASDQLLGRAAAAVNQSLVIRNWLIGAYIVEFEQNGEDRAKYRARLLASLAKDLQKHSAPGLSLSNLKSFRQFYQSYPQIGQTLSGFSGLPQVSEKSQTVSGQLQTPPPPGQKNTITPLSPQAVLRFSWSQMLEFIRLDDPLKRAFYENECLKGNWSVRHLQRQIGSLLFERTGLSKNKSAVVKRAHTQAPRETIEDLIRDPYVLEFTGLAARPEYTESELETALLNHLQKFLLELGVGFCFEARQFRVTLGNEHDYVDLVVYHRRLHCHVLIDLKIRPFRHGDAGQMNYYLNYFKDRMMGEGDQPPVGILLCSDKDHTKVEFATAGMDNKLFVARYLTALPSAEQLAGFVEKDRASIEALTNQARRRPTAKKRSGQGHKPRERKSPNRTGR